ncbi:thioredoxin family protein [Patescibacteria group bacterium]
MPQQENTGWLQFMVWCAIAVVIGIGIAQVFRAGLSEEPTPPAVAENESADTTRSTISSAWCDELEEGDCLPAVCEAKPHTIVVFHADWCPWCRKLKEDTLSDPAVIEALKPFGKVSVDTETNPATSAAYEVSGIPAIVVLDGNCNEVLRIPGFVDAERLLDELYGL